MQVFVCIFVCFAYQVIQTRIIKKPYLSVPSLPRVLAAAARCVFVLLSVSVTPWRILPSVPPFPQRRRILLPLPKRCRILLRLLLPVDTLDQEGMVQLRRRRWYPHLPLALAPVRCFL